MMMTMTKKFWMMVQGNVDERAKMQEVDCRANALFLKCVILSEVSKIIGGKKGVRLESVETCMLTGVWFWIV